MRDRDKTKEQLISELKDLRKELALCQRDQKQQHSTLQKSLQVYQTSIEHNYDPIIIFDKSGCISYCNNKLYQQSGYSRSELVGIHFSKIPFIQLKDVPRFLKIYKQVSKEQIPAPFDVVWKDRSGNKHHSEISVTLIKDDNVLSGFQMIAREVTTQREALQNVSESEKKFRTLTSIAPTAIFIICNMDIVYANEKCLQITGINKRALKKISFWDLVHPDHHTLVKKKIVNRIRKGKHPGKFEFKIVNQKTGDRWVMFSGAHFVYDDQPALLGTAFDITDRMLWEQKIRESEEKFRVMTENSPDVIMRFDRKYRHLYVNKAGEIQTGIPVNKFIGSTHEELGFPQNMCDFWHKQIQIVFDTGKPHKIEFDLDAPGGKINFEWRLNPEFAGDGSVSTVLTVARDLTPFYVANDALRKSESYFRSIFTNSRIANGIMDKEGNFITVNTAWCKMLGYTVEEMLKMNNMDLTVEDHFEKTTQVKERIFTGKEESIRFIKQLKRKDGTKIWVEISVAPIVETDGSIKYLLGSMHDINDQKITEEQNKELQAQLQHTQKMEAIGTLAGGIAHDFNNLLTVIIGQAELSLMKVDQDNNLNKDISAILSAGKRAENLTSQLLAFSRKQIYQPQSINLSSVISSQMNMLRRLIGEDIKINFNADKNIPGVVGDPIQIEQVMLNLLINAKDAIHEFKDDSNKKRIDVDIRNLELDSEYITSHPGSRPGHYIEITVTDTGIGMDEKTVERVFEPFFTTKAVNKGTGLGMSTVYGIVKQNDGYITIDSQPQAGTTVKVYWPVSVKKNNTKTDEDTTRSTYIGNEMILFVEDDEAVRNFTSQALEAYGYSLKVAKNGVDALNVLKETEDSGIALDNIKLVVTDLVMPEMNGTQLAEKLRELIPGIGIIFTSGYAQDQINSEGLVQEEINFIRKPYSVRTLTKKVREVLMSTDSS